MPLTGSFAPLRMTRGRLCEKEKAKDHSHSALVALVGSSHLSHLSFVVLVAL